MPSPDEYERLHESLRDLGRALDRLGEVLGYHHDEAIAIDATIHRFEFTFELLWKTIRFALQAEFSVEAVFPKVALQQAYAAGWIENESLWVEMLKSRNLTSHTYKEALAREIYGRIKGYYPEMRRLYEFLQARPGTRA